MCNWNRFQSVLASKSFTPPMLSAPIDLLLALPLLNEEHSPLSVSVTALVRFLVVISFGFVVKFGIVVMVWVFFV